ncbi:MAG: glycosyltransferase family 39 protein [Ferruginibacter sp.]
MMTAESRDQFSDKLFYLLLFIGIALNATGLFSPILEPDSALYASIAKRIALSNDWINLYGDGGDWLDKPHFPFWMAAAAFKIFGVGSFSYKLPAFLCWLLGIRFTYLLTGLLYNKRIAQFAVIIYVTALHAVIANFDVRAESYLTCCVMAGLYYMYRIQQDKNLRYIIFAAFFIACAVMTKGIFILVTIAGGFVIYWLLKKDWKQFINYRWWLMLLLIFIFILPELYALYVQFDLHPEKIIFGHTNVSGVKFFFWDSQFGRFFNTGPIKGKGDPTFFLHTTLWAFLPWSVLFVTALVQLFRRKTTFKKEHIVVYGSAAITFILFSFSGFQLPHYIVIIFPHFSIITAAYVYSIAEKQKVVSRLMVVHTGLNILLTLAIITLVIFCGFPFMYVIAGIILIIGVSSIWFFRKPNAGNLIVKGFFFAVLLYPFLNLVFYPNILKYQSGMQAANWMKANSINAPVGSYIKHSYSLDFYSTADVTRLENTEAVKIYAAATPVIIYTSKEYGDSLMAANFKVELLKTFSFYPVSRLNLKFLNAKTRESQLEPIVLLRISNQ